MPLPLPGRRPGRLRPGFPVPRRPHRQRRPVPDRPRPVHEREHHPRRDREPDEGLGRARVEGRLLLPEQLQAAEHLRELQQPDQLRRRREQPVRYRLQLRQRGDRRVQHLHAGLEVRAAGVALQELRVVRAGQLEGRQPADARLRRPLLLPDAAVGHDAAGLELPARPVQPQRGGAAVQPGVPRRLSVLGRRPPGHGPALIAPGVAPTLANTVEERFIGRLVPGSDRFNGAFQAGQGINDQLQDGNAFKIVAARRRRLRPHGQTGRRSCAAAGASSTTGRRATWCST